MLISSAMFLCTYMFFEKSFITDKIGLTPHKHSKISFDVTSGFIPNKANFELNKPSRSK